MAKVELKNNGGTSRMRLQDALRFVQENARLMPSKERLRASHWSCVDGRIKQSGRFAAPGGALGIKYALIGGVQQYEKNHGSLGIAFDRLTKAVEKALNGMTCHSDTHAVHAGKARISAGCGHCNGAIDLADQYGVERYVNLLIDHVNDMKARGMRPEVLSGDHGERAVLVISRSAASEPTVTLPGTGKDGTQAFICHLEDWLQTIEDLAPIVAKCAAKSPDLNSLKECVKAAAQRQLGVTLGRLAKGLPMYRVEHRNGEFVVELMVEDAATIAA